MVSYDLVIVVITQNSQVDKAKWENIGMGLATFCFINDKINIRMCEKLNLIKKIETIECNSI